MVNSFPARPKETAGRTDSVPFGSSAVCLVVVARPAAFRPRLAAGLVLSGRPSYSINNTDKVRGVQLQQASRATGKIND